MDWSRASSTRHAKIAGRGNRGISSGTRNRAPTTARNTKVSPVLTFVSPSVAQWEGSLFPHRARQHPPPGAIRNAATRPTLVRPRFARRLHPASGADMGLVIGNGLPLALAVAISPVPMIAVIMGIGGL